MSSDTKTSTTTHVVAKHCPIAADLVAEDNHTITSIAMANAIMEDGDSITLITIVHVTVWFREER